MSENDDAITKIRQQLWESNDLYEYTVVPVRQKLIGDKVDTSALQELLNKYAYEGWHVRTITEANVSGRIGPGGVSGLVVVFERRLVSV